MIKKEDLFIKYVNELDVDIEIKKSKLLDYEVDNYKFDKWTIVFGKDQLFIKYNTNLVSFEDDIFFELKENISDVLVTRCKTIAFKNFDFYVNDLYKINEKNLIKYDLEGKNQYIYKNAKVSLNGYCNEAVVIEKLDNLSYEIDYYTTALEEAVELFNETSGGVVKDFILLKKTGYEMFDKILSDSIVEEYIYSYVKKIEYSYYEIMGIIDTVKSFTNKFTNEKVYVIKVKVYNMYINIITDKIIGKAEKGKRLKCKIYLQGSII